MSTRISGLLLSVRNCHASVRDGNRADPFAVALVRGEAIVGHVPKKISSVCSLYLRRGLGVWKGVQRLQISMQCHLFYFRSQTVLCSSC